MILGVGTDIIEIARIRDAIERLGTPYLQRILCETELQYCREQNDIAPHVAARFAAKEAVAKALGIGICADLNWQDIEVRRSADGQPSIVLQEHAAQLLQSKGGRSILVSISHSSMHALAVAIIESHEQLTSQK